MFPFGVTFYPDQWPRETWEKEFLKIREAGLNCVRFGEMAWDWIEPEEGSFNFKGLDAAMDLAKKFGLKIILGIGTSQAPMWMISAFPEVRPVAHDGTLYPEYGPRPNVCRDNPIYKKYAKRYVKKIVARYSKHPALLSWQIDNEPVYPPLDVAELKDYCHCPATKKDFRDWAKAKFGKVGEMNRVWGMNFWTASFSSFSEVVPPKGGMWEAVSPHIFLDWQAFKSENLHSHLMWMKEAVKKIDRSHKVGTNGFIGISPRVPDHSVMSEGLDWYGWDIYPKGGRVSARELSMMADLWRSYAGDGAEFQVTELQGGSNVRWGYPDHVEGPEIRTWTHQVIAHGARAVLYHAWRPPLFGSEVGGFGILNTAGERTPRLDAIEKTAKEVASISDVILKHRPTPLIAIGHLRGSDVETYQEQGPSRAICGQWAGVNDDVGVMHSLRSISGAHSVVHDLFDPVAFIFEKHLENDSLPFQAVMLPNPYVMKEKHAKVLKKYVYDGGILITEARFGLKDENGHLYPHPLLESLVDVTYDHTELAGEDLTVPGLNLTVSGFRDVVQAKDGIIERFSDGSPAIIEKRFGKGKILYAAFSLFLSISKGSGDKAIDLLRAALPSPPVKRSGSDKVEIVYWDGDNPMLYMINHSADKERVGVRVAERFKSAEDILGGGTHSFRDGVLEGDFEAGGVKILRLTQ